MKVFTNINENIDFAESINLVPGNCFASVGFFDGVHLGHKYVIEQLQAAATGSNTEELLVTLWPHPSIYFNNPVNLLTTLEEKIKILRNAGLRNLLILNFDTELANMPKTEFVKKILIGQLSVCGIVMGYNNSFGSKEKAGLEIDRNLVKILKLPEFTLPDEPKVSSSIIRRYLEEGMVKEASNLLGYYFMISGYVEYGYQIGRKLGFPTANLSRIENYKLIPADGVYIAEVKIDGDWLPAMLNIGKRPTFNGNERTIEFHILNYEGDLYNRNLSVRFIRRIRGEIKFDNTNKLVEQLNSDREVTRLFFY